MKQPRSDVHAPEDEEEQMELPDDLNLDGGDDKDQEEGQLVQYFISAICLECSLTFLVNIHESLLVNIHFSLLVNIHFSLLMNIQFSFLVNIQFSFLSEYSVIICL